MKVSLIGSGSHLEADETPFLNHPIVMPQHKLVALLPMKANSERIRGKNFRSFAGKPLFRWILDTLLKIEEIEKIIINTDARHILSQYQELIHPRIVIRDRKPEICGDFTSMNLVIADDLEAIDSEAYLMTHATNPLLTPETIANGLTAYRDAVTKGSADSLFSVNAYQSRFYQPDGTPINHDPNNLIRTQDLPPLYEENSNFYIFSRASFESTHARIGNHPLLFPTLPQESIDIDNIINWKIAEFFALEEKSGLTHSGQTLTT